MLASLIFLGVVGLVTLSMLALVLLKRSTYTRPLMKSGELLVERHQKIANGWIPPRYADLQTDDERNAAITELMDL